MSQTAINWVDEFGPYLAEMSKEIWRYAEVGLQEFRSAALLADFLQSQGFEVQRQVAGMPTAFVAEYRRGAGPIVGILAEYDALPGLSQDNIPLRKPLVSGGPGHGCGHNLFGVASAAAAIAMRQAMERGEAGGTVRLYGCPAEETLVGKVFMARAGLFDDLDAAIAWHPADINSVWSASFLAMNSVKFTFHGIPAHAAVNPDAGRSALDAVELMNTGVNYLREHIIQDARIHYVITNGGGQPNVVPERAQVWYFVRAPQRRQVDEIYARVQKIAQGAALMTETTVEERFLTACWEYLPNQALDARMAENLQRLGGPGFDAVDLQWAQELAQTFAPGQREAVLRASKVSLPDDVLLHDAVLPPQGKGRVIPGSTDVGDVSWKAPTTQVVTACYPVGVAGHSWQLTASSGSEVGVKGMLLAAKSMALTGLDLLQDQDLLQQAQAEFRQATAQAPYTCAVADEVPPPLDQFDS
ncbi:MAG: amidohydrolase [Chloroflexi bacterium]|nr:amidohydrolase [Chloroflexota bacterium]